MFRSLIKGFLIFATTHADAASLTCKELFGESVAFEAAAVRFYQTGGAHRINQLLRGGYQRVFDSDIRETQKQKDILLKLSLKETLPVGAYFRAISLDRYQEQSGVDLPISEGIELQDKGFQSFSRENQYPDLMLNSWWQQKKALVILQVSTSDHLYGYVVNSKVSAPGLEFQKEVILAPGQSIRIKSVKHIVDHGGVTVIEAEPIDSSK